MEEISQVLLSMRILISLSRKSLTSELKIPSGSFEFSLFLPFLGTPECWPGFSEPVPCQHLLPSLKRENGHYRVKDLCTPRTKQSV